MSLVITLKPGTHDGDSSMTEGMPPGLVYLDAKLEASDEQYSGIVSGWMRPEARALLKAAPNLLEKLDQLTLVVGLTAFKHEDQRAVLQQAMDEARAAIAKARGES
jgi:hypothetical protein